MNKEKVKTQKGLVLKLRILRDKVNQDIQNMSLDEEIKYLEDRIAKWETHYNIH